MARETPLGQAWGDLTRLTDNERAALRRDFFRCSRGRMNATRWYITEDDTHRMLDNVEEMDNLAQLDACIIIPEGTRTFWVWPLP